MSQGGGDPEKQESDRPRQKAPLARQPKQQDPQGTLLTRQPQQQDPLGTLLTRQPKLQDPQGTPIARQPHQRDPQGTSIARQPKQRNPQGTPLARQPKQQDPEDEDDQGEPVAEPEPSHHKGDPRTHAFHSWLYQKIDPKVREARRKKFFGSGRRKRDTTGEDEGQMVGKENLEEDLLLEVFGSKDLEEGDQNTDASRKGRSDGSPQNSGSRFHAFHSWLHLP